MCRSLSSLGLLCLLVGFGCGGGKSSANLNVSGKVTYNGAPAQHVLVTLTDDQNHDFSGTTDEEGKFLISGVTAGDKKVMISAKHTTAPTDLLSGGAQVEKNTKPGMKTGGGALDQKSKDMIKEKMAKEKDTVAKLPTPVEATKIPTKYADATKSGLTWNVSAENLNKDFNLND
jgi:hypothetical protein